MRSDIITDGLGRVRIQRQYEDASHYIETATEYDALGRLYSVTAPFRPGDPVGATLCGYD